MKNSRSGTKKGFSTHYCGICRFLSSLGTFICRVNHFEGFYSWDNLSVVFILKALHICDAEIKKKRRKWSTAAKETLRFIRNEVIKHILKKYVSSWDLKNDWSYCTQWSINWKLFTLGNLRCVRDTHTLCFSVFRFSLIDFPMKTTSSRAENVGKLVHTKVWAGHRSGCFWGWWF